MFSEQLNFCPLEEFAVLKGDFLFAGNATWYYFAAAYQSYRVRSVFKWLGYRLGYFLVR